MAPNPGQSAYRSPMQTGPLYHGTESDFTTFDAAKWGKMTGCQTHGFWFTDSRDAADYYHSGPECGGRVIVARLSMENPLEVTAEQFADNAPHGPTWWAQQARALGHDAVILRGIVDGDRRSTVYAVFDSDQIEIQT